MQRVSFYIDGFNVYHKIDEYQYKTGICYKWLNYKTLLSSYLRQNEILQDIYFFTAIDSHREEDSIERHNKYITALENINLTVIPGKFVSKPVKCKVIDCNHDGNKMFTKSEEKQTDVNLAINMVIDARNEKYDKCFLLSSDSDFIPALKKVRELNKIPGLILPPQDESLGIKMVNTSGLREACYDELNKRYIVVNLSFDRFVNHILPKEVKNIAKNISVSMPEVYHTREDILKILERK